MKRGHQITIEVADGTYDTSSIPAADMPRPAIVYVTDTYAGERSYNSSGLVGSIVIRGASQAGTIIETGADYTYGVYCSQVPNVAIENLTIRGDGVNTASGLLVAHRGCYVQANDITVDGQNDCNNGVIAEAGGVRS